MQVYTCIIHVQIKIGYVSFLLLFSVSYIVSSRCLTVCLFICLSVSLCPSLVQSVPVYVRLNESADDTDLHV